MIIVLRDFAHRVFLDAKKLRHYVFSTRFEKGLAKALPEQIKIIEDLIKKGDVEAVKNFIDVLLDGELQSMSIERLRLLAKQYHVKEYYSLTKTQLIERINNAKKRYSGSIA